MPPYEVTRSNSIVMTLSFQQIRSSLSLIVKPYSHWDATSSRWVCESIRQTVANCRETFAWYRKVLACIVNSSRTVRQSFKHVILFCATKIIAKPSPSHRICRKPVANPSQTFANTSQGSSRDLHNATNMRHK